MDKEKMLRLMKFWLFGTFVILFAATTVYLGQFLGLEIMKTWEYWVTMAAAAVLSYLIFVFYKGYLAKQ
ncbi:MAG: hypothetical protein HON98_04975 [Chloroflexi bacterium]|nr:hypothetical protein [Chloroflexota bacterium]MBT3670253.1 hypothetical protein [Chloroflexota bacterium]MBT4003150.1 hypothetical protein [Chloroflexota bacterium]MBT4306074.1 hypothetical protein [Chloroflexota bacterium]MBT4534453.1 hypothetical protein [Chloroflexota bacterium]